MLDLGFALLVGSISIGLGLRVVEAAGRSDDDASDLALALPCGLGILALAVASIAALGLLGPRSLLGLLAVGGLVAAGPVAGVVRRARRPTRPDGTIGLLMDGALALTLVGTLISSLAPVTDGDALCYHLQVPKVFLGAGGLAFEPDLHETIYPLTAEMLDALCLGLSGPIACRLVQWTFGVSLAMTAAALARPALGRRSRWAATVALGVPAVANGMSAPLNDVALAAFGNAALLAWLRWRDRPGPGRLALVGVLAGFGIGTKYPGLVWLAVLASGTFAVGRDRSMSTRLRDLATLVACAAIAGGFWYVRAWVATGNPVFPFFRGVFGSGLDDVLDPIKRPMRVSPGSLATALGSMTLDPARFDSLAHQFGPAFLLMAPALVLLRPPRRVAGPAIAAWLFLELCLTQRQSTRFVLIVVGPFAAASAWGASAWWDRGSAPARGVAWLLAAIVAAESGLAVARARRSQPYLTGVESAAAYLDRREPTHVVGTWIGDHLPPTARVIGQDHRGFYIPRPYSMELAHRRRTGLASRGESPREIVETLSGRGFTHLLMCPPIVDGSVEFDATLSRRLAPWLDGRRPLYRADLADGDGVVRRYALYALDDEPRIADRARAPR